MNIIYIFFFVGLFFFLDTVLPEKYKKTRYKHWYHYIPGSYTLLYLYDVSRGVKWNPDYRPLVLNFKVTKEEVKMYIFTRLQEYYKMNNKSVHCWYYTFLNRHNKYQIVFCLQQAFYFLNH